MTSTQLLSSTSSYSMFALASNDVSASTVSSSSRVPYLASSYEPPLAEDGRPAFWLVFFESVAIGFLGTFFLLFFVITIACLCRSSLLDQFRHRKRSLSRGCYLIFSERRERHRTPMSTSSDDEPVYLVRQTPMTTLATRHIDNGRASHPTSLPTSSGDEPVDGTTQTPTAMGYADKDIHLVLNPGRHNQSRQDSPIEADMLVGDLLTCLAVKDQE